MYKSWIAKHGITPKILKYILTKSTSPEKTVDQSAALFYTFIVKKNLKSQNKACQIVGKRKEKYELYCIIVVVVLLTKMFSH